jgi:phospholipase/carboxylesterase
MKRMNEQVTLSRRDWLRLTSVGSLGALVSATASACGKQLLAPLEDPEAGHLVARPGATVFTPTIGTSELGLGTTRDGLRFVPSTYRAGEALPLLVTLHGAGGNAYGGIQPFLAFAEAARVVLVSPDSRDTSWDRRYGGFGADWRFLDNALSDTYLQCAIDPQRIGIAGFSDGASYALSLGLTNGDLFRQILAFSPGFMVPNVRRGRPAVFVSHGTRDSVLPIDTTSRVFVPKLRAWGNTVTYREFDGTHQLPAPVADEAFAWLRTAWGVPAV